MLWNKVRVLRLTGHLIQSGRCGSRAHGIRAAHSFRRLHRLRQRTQRILPRDYCWLRVRHLRHNTLWQGRLRCRRDNNRWMH